MLVRLESAKNMICPVRVKRDVCASDAGGVPRVAVSTNVGVKCVGDDCMGWRWESKNHGYCGLAGPAKGV